MRFRARLINHDLPETPYYEKPYNCGTVVLVSRIQCNKQNWKKYNQYSGPGVTVFSLKP